MGRSLSDWSGPFYVRRSVKAVLRTLDHLRPPVLPPTPLVVLIYHSVGAGVSLELDIPTVEFRRQMAHLVKHTEVVSLDRALGDPAAAGTARLRVVLTFDDAYESFVSVVAPILADHGLASIVYVPTQFCDTGDDYPWLRDARAAMPKRLRPMTWDEIGAVASARNIEVGSHAHSHRPLDTLDQKEIEADLRCSIHRLRTRTGVSPRHFCYPEGRHSARDLPIVRHLFQSAVIGRGRWSGVPFNPWRIPRLPVQQSDTFASFRAALDGRMRLYDSMLRTIRRS